MTICYVPPLFSSILSSGTTTEFCIPDHWVQAAVMVKKGLLSSIRTFFGPLLELFRTFSRFTRLNR